MCSILTQPKDASAIKIDRCAFTRSAAFATKESCFERATKPSLPPRPPEIFEEPRAAIGIYLPCIVDKINYYLFPPPPPVPQNVGGCG